MSDIPIAQRSYVDHAERLPWRWLNRSVTRYCGTMEQLRPLLPKFERRPGRHGEHEIVTRHQHGVVVGASHQRMN